MNARHRSRRRIPAEAVPGIVLMAAAALAMLLANSAWAEAYDSLLHARLAVGIGGFEIAMTSAEWVKNLLMAVFFLHAGTELKIEVKEGALSSRARAMLPMLAAAGGVVAPALIFLAIAGPAGFGHGWAVPTATDIAFALGVLALAGPRVPAMLKAFLLGVAVVDDLAAILIIAIFYSGPLAAGWLAAAGLVYALMLWLNARRSSHLGLYLLLAVPLWVSVQMSGVNPTVAGVLTALALPMRDRGGRPFLVPVAHRLTPYVVFGIMPVFALATAGAKLPDDIGDLFGHPLTLGILLGLLVGKPLGISIITIIGARVLRVPLPGRTIEVVGLGCIAGVGFTMSLFVAKLAFPGAAAEAMVKVGVYGGSLASAAAGLLLLTMFRRPRAG